MCVCVCMRACVSVVCACVCEMLLIAGYDDVSVMLQGKQLYLEIVAECIL